MTPTNNALPELPEPQTFVCAHLTDGARWVDPQRPYYTADQMRAYGELCRSEALQRVSDKASEMLALPIEPGELCRASAGREAVATDPMTLSAPEKVWLQVTTDADEEDERLPIPRESWMDLSWCYESIGGHEVVYIREDLVPTAPELPKQGEGGREDHSGNAAEMVAVESIIETMLCAAALLEQSGSVINRREGAALRVQADELRALAKKAEEA